MVTGNIGRDVCNTALKEQLYNIIILAGFHTKKSKETVLGEWILARRIDRDVGQTWLIKSGNMEANGKSQNHYHPDIPTFFRYNRIVVCLEWGSYFTRMNTNSGNGWERPRRLTSKSLNTFVMSYGTFVWFKYDALKPLFDLGGSSRCWQKTSTSKFDIACDQAFVGLYCLGSKVWL